MTSWGKTVHAWMLASILLASGVHRLWTLQFAAATCPCFEQAPAGMWKPTAPGSGARRDKARWEPPGCPIDQVTVAVTGTARIALALLILYSLEAEDTSATQNMLSACRRIVIPTLVVLPPALMKTTYCIRLRILHVWPGRILPDTRTQLGNGISRRESQQNARSALPKIPGRCNINDAVRRLSLLQSPSEPGASLSNPTYPECSPGAA